MFLSRERVENYVREDARDPKELKYNDERVKEFDVCEIRPTSDLPENEEKLWNSLKNMKEKSVNDNGFRTQGRTNYSPETFSVLIWLICSHDKESSIKIFASLPFHLSSIRKFYINLYQNYD